MRTTIPITAVVLAAFGLAAPAPAPQFGQTATVDAPLQDGITVTGSGTARLLADTAEVRLRVRARGKTLEVAKGEFDGKRALLGKVLKGFEGSESRSNGVTIGPESSDRNSFVFDGSDPGPPLLEMNEVITVRLQASATDLEPVVSLISEAKDAACVLDADAPNPYAMYMDAGQRTVAPVRFFAGEASTKEARELAMARAFQDAKQRAETLARVAGLQLREVQAVRVVKPFEAGARGSGNSEREIRVEVRFRVLP